MTFAEFMEIAREWAAKTNNYHGSIFLDSLAAYFYREEQKNGRAERVDSTKH